ncbi:TonB-dependent receptor [Candidatus Methylospira mobilis]|uniref:TonB-dependent receptor n=1 Tax=Candidatus Methylospira mobilis TaxID=1808979 RepID=A0A5Q0BL48_9GAMM|nr:TonB-dependent receptor [Candidatus Methylospira mobilis]QFY44563.1 TonB-dependent receptor [Candidatus Methylospira mobilis]
MKTIKSLKSPEGNFFTRNSLVLAIAMAISIPATPVNAASPAQAGAANAVPFDIPAQNLSSALAAYNAQSHVQVQFDSGLVQGLRSTPLKGSYTPAQALQHLLTATGLQSRFTGAGTATLAGKSAGVAAAGGADTLGTVTVSAAATAGNTFDAPEDRIHYALPDASTAMKTDTPIMETPASIQVVPRAVMDDQQVISVEDALKNVAGVQMDTGSFYVNTLIRGFDVNSGTYRNGLLDQNIANLETANLSSIEVVKGAMSTLYGRMNAGGMIDLITKRPEEQARYSLQQQFGSYSLYRTTLDATGPILEDKSLLYRLNFAYKANNSFRDYVNADHIFVNPSITWKPTDSFDLNANMEYQHDNWIFDSGLVAYKGAIIKLPLSSYLGDGTALQSQPNVQDRKLAAYDWNYRFNDDWKLTNRFMYSNVIQQNNIFNGLSMLNANTLQMGLGYGNTYYLTTYTTNLDLTGKFDTGFINHSVLLGFDYYYYTNNQTPSHQGPVPSILPNVNIYAPYQTNPLNLAAAPVNYSYQLVNKWDGLYFQDQMKLWDQLHILFGGRWDWADYGSASGGGKPLSAFSVPTIHTNAFKPRAGILYQPWDWGSAYFNYTESFGLNNGISITGQPFAPQTAVQYEFGVKTEFFDKRLLTTLALYSITQNNLLQPNPANSAFSIAIGQARSKGLELQTQGQVTKNISLIGGYSYDAAKIIQATDGTQGNMLPNVPLNSGNLWTKYAFDDDVLPGVSLGTGVYLAGPRAGDTINSFQLPGYARWDASATYSFEQFGGKITTQLNVYNILNQMYYTNTQNSAVHIVPGIPLTLLGSVKVEF